MTVKNSALKDEKAQTRLYYGWIVVGVSFVTILIVYIMRYDFSLFYAAILDEFNWSRANTAGVFSVNLIVYAIGAPLIGRLVDTVGIRKIVPIGAIIFGLSLIGCSKINNILQLYIAFGFLALGTCAAGYVPHLAILPNWFEKKRGLAIGVTTSALMVSLVAAPGVGYFISSLGWRGTCLIFTLIGIIFIAPVAAILQRQKPADKGLLPDGIYNKRMAEKDDKAGGEQVLIVDHRWATMEWTLAKAMRTKRFWLATLMSFFFGIWGYSILVHQVAYLKHAGYASMVAAGLVGVFGVLAVIGSLCGFISDRWGREITYFLGSIIAILGITTLNLTTSPDHAFLPYIYAVLMGFSYGWLSPVSSVVYADLFQGKHFGSINGFIISCFVAGGALGPWLLGYIFDISGNYNGAFPIFYISIAASAMFCWLAAPRKVRRVPGKLSVEVNQNISNKGR